MNFFEAQDRARRQTGWLVLLFGLAVAGLILLTYFLLLGVLAFNQTGSVELSPTRMQQLFHWDLLLGVAVVIVALVFLGSLYKSMALSGGGRSVAEMLGGRLLSPDSRVPQERVLLNVVEEMAIAAGMPVPQVFLLDEPGINAFAAGLTPNDAVIGITRGAMESLSRDELQGVVAHEFSHIFNGDMRLNIRLIGVLHGILLLGIMGYYLLRATRYMRRSRNQKGGEAVIAIIALGAGLVVIGYVGYFFGQWIKAMVSRQREYLADASAVQFTRDRQGIAGALKKIGAASHGSLLESPAAPEYSHAFFARGVRGFLQSLFATHPPLPVRIRRIEPNWDGEYLAPVNRAAASEPEAAPAPGRSREERLLGGVIAAGVLSAGKMIGQVGSVNARQVHAARELIDAIPQPLREAAAEPYGARALIYGLLMDPHAEVADEQRRLIGELADPAVAALRERLMEPLQGLPGQARLPLLELSMPALLALSPEQYQRFRRVVQALIAADKKVDLQEWILQRLVILRLDVHFGLRKPARAVHGHLGTVRDELVLLLSLIAHTEYPVDAGLAARAFEAGCAEAGETGLVLLPRDALNLQRLNGALDTLEQLKPLVKPRLLKGCAACIMYDGRVTVPALELLRAIASSLDSPMPLLSLFEEPQQG